MATGTFHPTMVLDTTFRSKILLEKYCTHITLDNLYKLTETLPSTPKNK